MTGRDDMQKDDFMFVSIDGTRAGGMDAAGTAREPVTSGKLEHRIVSA
jgi:hypothetical protein